MFKPDNEVPKSHASGSWRVIRSMAVPANVTPAPSNESLAHHSAARKIQKVEEESILLKARKTPGYFENSDPSFSNT